MPTTITIESNQSPTDTSHSQSDDFTDTEGSSGTGVHIRQRGVSPQDQYSDELGEDWASVYSDDIEPSESASRPPTQNRHRSQDAYTAAPRASTRRHRTTEQAPRQQQARRVRRQHAPAPPESSVDPHDEAYTGYGQPYPAPQVNPFGAGMSRPPYAQSSYSSPPGAPFAPFGAGPGALTHYGQQNPFPYGAPGVHPGNPFSPQPGPSAPPGAGYFGAPHHPHPMPHHAPPGPYGQEIMPYGHPAYGGMPGHPQHQYGALPPHIQPPGMAHHANFYSQYQHAPSEISTTDPALERKLLQLAEEAKKAKQALADRDAKEAAAKAELEALKKAEETAIAAAKQAAADKEAWEKRLKEETEAAKRAGEEAAKRREIAEAEARKKAAEDRIAYQRRFEAEWAASMAKAAEEARKAQEAAAEAAKKAAEDKAAWEKRLAEETAAAKKAGEEAAKAAEAAATEAKKKVAEEQAAWQKKLQDELRSQMLKHAEDVKKAEEAAAEAAKKAAEEKAAWEKKIEEEKQAALAKGIEQAKKAEEAAKKKAEQQAAEEKAKADALAELAKIKADALAEQEKLKKEAAEAAKKAKEDAEKALADATKKPDAPKKPIRFKDAVGRKFNFPFDLCKTWAGMDELIQQAFAHVDVVGPRVRAGHFDLIGPNGEMILKQVWETVIEPDWTITMSMWPQPERTMHHGAIPERPRSRHGHAHGHGGRGPAPPPNGLRGGPGPGPGPGPSRGEIPPPPMHGYDPRIRMGGGPPIIAVPEPRPSKGGRKKSESSKGVLGWMAGAGGSKPSKSSGKDRRSKKS